MRRPTPPLSHKEKQRNLDWQACTWEGKEHLSKKFRLRRKVELFSYKPNQPSPKKARGSSGTGGFYRKETALTWRLVQVGVKAKENITEDWQVHWGEDTEIYTPAETPGTQRLQYSTFSVWSGNMNWSSCSHRAVDHIMLCNTPEVVIRAQSTAANAYRVKHLTYACKSEKKSNWFLNCFVT